MAVSNAADSLSPVCQLPSMTRANSAGSSASTPRQHGPRSSRGLAEPRDPVHAYLLSKQVTLGRSAIDGDAKELKAKRTVMLTQLVNETDARALDASLDIMGPEMMPAILCASRKGRAKVVQDALDEQDGGGPLPEQAQRHGGDLGDEALDEEEDDEEESPHHQHRDAYREKNNTGHGSPDAEPVDLEELLPAVAAHGLEGQQDQEQHATAGADDGGGQEGPASGSPCSRIGKRES
ncbi:hypothetical protein DL770_002409 [Monosporascus sp. CRB-9-2]|nr:hypothetical protein DL770_002409 [Monosporascus sp. CRB-9-2]